MAMVSGRGSTLNPNARPFIPAAYRQVEDFSSEWWNLVQNSSSFHNYWLSERQEASFEGSSDPKDDDITSLLPDTFDVGYDEEFSCVDAAFEDLVKSSETYETRGFRTEMKSQDREMSGLYGGSILKNSVNLNSLPSNRRGINTLIEPAKYSERPVQCFSPSYGVRLVHQPR